MCNDASHPSRAALPRRARRGPLGATSSVVYDSQNRPITATDPLERQSVLSYDANADLVRETTGITTGSPGLTTLFTYTVPAGGEALLTEQRTPEGVVTHYDDNAVGQVLTATVGDGTQQAQATPTTTPGGW